MAVKLEARSEKSPAKRIQAFQRFILEQLHKEESSSDGKSSNSTSLTSVEDLSALLRKKSCACAQCSRDENKDMRKFQIDLQYPSDRSIPRPSFVDLLVKSMCIKQEVRAWCESHKAYTRMAQTKFPKKLPNVLSISLGMRDMLDLHWWGSKPMPCLVPMVFRKVARALAPAFYTTRSRRRHFECKTWVTQKILKTSKMESCTNSQVWWSSHGNRTKSINKINNSNINSAIFQSWRVI